MARWVSRAFLCSSMLAHADTDADRIKRLEDQIKALQEQMQKLKDDQAARDKAQVASAVKRTGQPPQPGAPAPVSAGSLKFSGDATIRMDLTNLSSLQTGLFPEGTQGVARDRFRLNLASPLSAHSEVGGQLSTGETTTPTLATSPRWAARISPRHSRCRRVISTTTSARRMHRFPIAACRRTSR